jgi:hypothetical protein
MTQTRPPGRAYWLSSAVLAAVAATLVVVVFAVVEPQRHDLQTKPKGLTSSEQQALDTGTKEVVNLLTYARKSFDADYARTLAGATGALLSDLQSKKATILGQITQGKFDLSGSVTQSAFEEISGNNSLILVSADGYKLPDGGQRTLTSTARFELTMTKVKGKWLASDLQSVGLI